jgi:pimeloyl-ACP methyl ester carboxylesterase
MREGGQVLFLQGGGAGVHDGWDSRLVAGLRSALGAGWTVRYPALPDEADPSLDAWGAAIRRWLDGLDDGAVVVGHSIGGTVLMAVLADDAPPHRLGAVVLVAAPFVGPGGWPGDALPAGLGERLLPATPVHVLHGLDDPVVPPEHAGLWARAIPHARLHLLPGRDHQLGDDAGPIAALIP